MVFLGEDTLLCGHLPVNVQFGVAEEQSTICLGMVEIVALVGEDGCLAEDGETVGKASWYEELTMVVRGEFDGIPLAVGGAAVAQINRYIQHLADGATD